MQLRRTLPVIGFAAMAVAIACSDSGTTAPDGSPRTNVATNGQSDTGKSPTNPTTPPAPKPDTGKQNPTSPTNPTTPPDTGKGIPVSNDPRVLVGTVIGMGPAPDTANYQKVARATVVLSLPADESASIAEVEVARTTTGADGTFSLGTFKLAKYALTVIPADGSPYKGTHWTFTMSPYSGAKVDLTVWLGRK